MGAMLQKPCMSCNIERKYFANGFKVGMAEVNGWRNKMEDAHVIRSFDNAGFFGVFDGHGGDQCSKHVSKEFYARLDAQGLPADDASLKKMILDIDAHFLATEQGSGTTGAMCICHRPAEAGGKIRLRVANVGDSRVFVGKRDGSIVDGGGTEEGLTTDHKPNHPSEKERIYRCGGTVETAEGGVARVNGDLAVSRCFGDAEYKKTGGPGPEDRPVTADPELGEFECDEDDILIIVCDGVSEGDFPNQEVVKFIAERLKENNDDVGLTSRDVVFRAEEKNSKDNITCMIITFNNKDGDVDTLDLIPGPLMAIGDAKFRDAWKAMAARGEKSVGSALEMRYEYLLKEVDNEQLAEGKREDLKAELEKLSGLKDIEGEKGSEERQKAFEEWFDKSHDSGDSGGGPSGIPPGLQALLGGLGGGIPPHLLSGANAKPDDGRKVKICGLEELQSAVEAHPDLKWDQRMKDLGEAEGILCEEDTSDGTMQVRFAPPISMKAWLPTKAVTITEDGSAGESGYEGGAPSPAP